MSGAFLPEARKLVFLGEAGCGKSEIAVQLALELAAQGRAVRRGRGCVRHLPVRFFREGGVSLPAGRLRL